MATGAIYTNVNQNLVFNGVPMSFSRAAGTWCDMQWADADEVKMFPGVAGFGMYIRTENLAATTTLTVLANGPENDVLNVAYLAAREAPNGIRYGIFVQQGTTVYNGLGVIMGRPPVTMSDGVMTNSWRFASLEMQGSTGSLPGAPLP